MTVSDWFTALGVVVAGISALIALRASRDSRRANKESGAAMQIANAIQEEMLRLEQEREAKAKQAEQKAELSYDLVPRGSSKELRIINRGPGIATELSVECSECIAQEFPAELDPGAFVHLLYALTHGSPQLPHFLVRWRHPSGELDQLKGYLS